ncbi:unnamed protein product [marine sediment metagenome]|uniref:Uncharacterized protein n=1 Tax=marine sediment metagenome TaxID=412755 RepID=X1CNR5_9ZZZZ
MLKKELKDILCCPKCKGDLEERDEKLICIKCDLGYPIKNDIPIMLIDQAEKLDSTNK